LRAPGHRPRRHRAQTRVTPPHLSVDSGDMRALMGLFLVHSAWAEADPKQLQLLSDGKGHYVVFSPKKDVDDFYYGDGKTFWAQRVGSRGGETTPEGVWKKFGFSFWEPRVAERSQASFDFDGSAYSVTCDTRKTELKPIAADESAKLLASAKLEKPRWTRRAHRLMRDDRGNYYYVDVLRDSGTGHRLFVGPKGRLKLAKMTNIVADSE